MSVQGSIHLFFKKKYTYRGVHRILKRLNLEDFNLSPLIKSRYYNEIDFRLYTGKLTFTFEGKQLVFDLAVEEYDNGQGTNSIKLGFKGSNRDTFESVYYSNRFCSIFKKLKFLEGIALVGDDPSPCNDEYVAFKNGEFDIYL